MSNKIIRKIKAVNLEMEIPRELLHQFNNKEMDIKQQINNIKEKDKKIKGQSYIAI